MHSSFDKWKAKLNKAVLQGVPRRYFIEIYDFATRGWINGTGWSNLIFNKIDRTIKQLYKSQTCSYWCLGSICWVGMLGWKEKLPIQARNVFLREYEVLKGKVVGQQIDREGNGDVSDLWVEVSNYEMQGDQERITKMDCHLHNSRILQLSHVPQSQSCRYLLRVRFNLKLVHISHSKGHLRHLSVLN